MRATWKGFVGFGLVQIPVGLYKATGSHDVPFHQHHGPACHGRVGRKTVCVECGEEVPYTEIVSGVEVDGRLVVVTKDEKLSLEEERGSQIEIRCFVDQSEIDPVLFENSYYVGTDAGEKAYALLSQAMAGSGLVALASMYGWGKSRVVLLRVVEGVLMLHTLLWPDELRGHETVPGTEGADFSPQEMRAASALVESMVGKFDPDDYVDHYQERLKELVAARAEGEPFVPGHKVDLDATDVSDLLAKLEASIASHPAGKKRAVKKAAPRRAQRRKGAA